MISLFELLFSLNEVSSLVFKRYLINVQQSARKLQGTICGIFISQPILLFSEEEESNHFPKIRTG